MSQHFGHHQLYESKRAQPIRRAQATRRSQAEGLRLYLEEIRRLPPLPDGEQDRLLRRIRRGDRSAIGEMALRNLGLVAQMAVPEGAHHDEDALGRLERGNQALVEAIVSFASGSRAGFRAFARSHIRRALRA